MTIGMVCTEGPLSLCASGRTNRPMVLRPDQCGILNVYPLSFYNILPITNVRDFPILIYIIQQMVIVH